jgi:hypothetical protein
MLHEGEGAAFFAEIAIAILEEGNSSPQRHRGRGECNYIFLQRGQKYINCHKAIFCFPASHRETKFTESLRSLRLVNMCHFLCS